MFLFQVPLTVGRDVQQFVNSEFFAYTIPFLLTFAIVYGLLAQVKVPKEKQQRAVLSFLTGLLVLPLAPTLVGFFSPLASSLLILVSGILVFLILIELLGLRESVEYTVQHKDPRTGQVIGEEKRTPQKNLFEKHGSSFAIILIIFASIIFTHAGGFELIGINTPTFFLNAPVLFFMVVVLLVVWMVTEKGSEKE